MRLLLINLFWYSLPVFFFTAAVRPLSRLHFAHFYILIIVFFLLLFRFGSRPKPVAEIVIFVVIAAKLISDIFMFGEVKVSSYVLLLSHLAIISLSFRSMVWRHVRPAHMQWFAFLSIVHSLLIISQFFEMNVLGSDFLLNPLQSWSPYGPDPLSVEPGPYNPEMQSIKRPNGLGWEPSAAGVMQLFSITVMLVARRWIKYFPVVIIINTVAALLTFSILTWGAIFSVLLIFFFAQRTRRRSVAYITLGFVGCMLVAVSLILGSWGYVDKRFSEVAQAGSSGYLRLVAPVEVSVESSSSFIGVDALGMRGYNEMPQYENSRRTELSGIANTYLEFIYHFGFVGVLLFLIFALAIYQKAFDFYYAAPLLTLLFGGYMFNSVYFVWLSVYFICVVSFLKFGGYNARF